jgi:DNA polymerase epsilon subunit 2
MRDKQTLNRVLFQQGIKVRPNALTLLFRYCSSRQLTEESDEFEGLVSRMMKHSIIDEEALKDVIQLPEEGDVIDCSTCIAVVNVMRSLQKWNFSSASGAYTLGEPPSYFPGVQSRVSMLRRRLLTVYNRVKTYPLFNRGQGDDYVELCSVNELEGRTGERCVIGMLTSPDGASYYIQDFGGMVKLSLTEAEYNSGFYPLTSIVIAQGVYRQDTFIVRSLAQPTLQPRTLYQHKVDLFGGVSLIEAAKTDETKSVFRCEFPDYAQVVVLSNVYLDNKEVLDKIELMLRGFSQFACVMFVLMGNFCSKAVYSPEVLIELFTTLAQVIDKFPEYKATAYWLLIPGPNDIGLGPAMPRDSLPLNITAPLAHIPNLVSSSNPTRVLFAGKELVFVRANCARRLQKTTIVEPNWDEADSVETHFVHTVLKQGHLVPLPDTPLNWDFDFALELCPLPAVVFYGENLDYFTRTLEGCTMVNPGVFAKNFTFVSVNVSDLRVQRCSVDD